MKSAFQWGLLLAWLLTAAQPSHAQLTLEAQTTLSAGCTLGQPTKGTLALSINWDSISTDLPGGIRPSVVVTNIGSSVLTYGTYAIWSHYPLTGGGNVVTPSTTTIEMRDAPTAGNKLGTGLQHTFTTTGSRMVYFVNAATDKNRLFYTTGTFQLTTGLTCI